MKELIGKKILEVGISDDKGWLLIRAPHNEYFLYLAEGDCCAQCYIQHISGIEYLIGSTIARVEVKDKVRSIKNEVDDLYWDDWGYKLTTSRGYCDIDMRLDSNGYYGGYFNIIKEEDYTIHCIGSDESIWKVIIHKNTQIAVTFKLLEKDF